MPRSPNVLITPRPNYAASKLRRILTWPRRRLRLILIPIAPHSSEPPHSPVFFIVTCQEYWARGYEEVTSPNMYNMALWETSGHAAHYKDSMFRFPVEGTEFGTYVRERQMAGFCGSSTNLSIICKKPNRLSAENLVGLGFLRSVSYIK